MYNLASVMSSTNRTIVASGAEQTLHDARISFASNSGININDTRRTVDNAGQIVETVGDGSFTLNQAADDAFVLSIDPTNNIFEQIPAIQDLQVEIEEVRNNGHLNHVHTSRPIPRYLQSPRISAELRQIGRAHV